MGAGIFDGVWGLLSMQYGLALEGMRDYGRYMLGGSPGTNCKRSRSRTKSHPRTCLRYDAIMADPTGFAKKMWDALINAEDGKADPGAALGELVRLQFLPRSPLAVEMRLGLLQCLNPYLSLVKA